MTGDDWRHIIDEAAAIGVKKGRAAITPGSRVHAGRGLVHALA